MFFQTPMESQNYASLRRQITHNLQLIDRFSLEPGDRVVISMADEYLCAAAWLTCMLDGLVPVILSAQMNAEKLVSIVDATEAALILSDCTGAISDNLVAKTQRISRVQRSLFENFGYVASRRRRNPRCETSDKDTAYLLFTSGTTGNPSGVSISVGALAAHLSTLTRVFGYSAESCLANATDLAHTDGLVHGLLVTCYSGARLFRPGDMTSLGLEDWLDSLAKFGASHLITNPTVLQIVLKQALHTDYFKHTEFSAVISSASTLHPFTWEEFETRFSCEVCNLYGMTETVANATYAGSFPGMGQKGTIGKPIDCEARVTDIATGVSMSEGIGDLEIKGSNIFDGYWRDEERTRKVLQKDGWFRTGDLAAWDSNNNLRFHGRSGNQIVSGGLTIDPAEIDEALLQHKYVTKSVTLSVPHSEFGEIAVSSVMVCERVTSVDLMRHARERLEPLKVPKRICILDAIPTGDSGKPKYAELRRLLEQELTASDLSPYIGLGPTEDAIPLHEEVMAVAAEVFCVDTSDLELEDTAEDVDGWDSFTHLTLLVEIERHFNFTIPAAKVAQVRSLSDIVKIIEDD